MPTLRKEISNYYQSRKKISIPIKIGLDGYKIMTILNIFGSGFLQIPLRLRKRLGLNNEDLEKYIQHLR